MTLKDLLAAVYQQPESLVFDQVIATIDSEFYFTPTAFANGSLKNSADQNQGSCKVFSFASKSGLSEPHTLTLFAEHYRDVLANPDGDNHQNIREFMHQGWKAVSFQKIALKKK